MNAREQLAQVSYTVESRRGATSRKTKEVPVSRLMATLAKLEERGGHSFDVRYESRPTDIVPEITVFASPVGDPR